jgi:hypothetical protein
VTGNEIERLRLSDATRKELEARLARARKRNPQTIYPGTNAVMIASSIGCAIYASPDGDVFMEAEPVDDIGGDWVLDRTPLGRVKAMSQGSDAIPELAQLLPARPNDAPDCVRCSGKGQLSDFAFKVLCPDCGGLGWPLPEGAR